MYYLLYGVKFNGEIDIVQFIFTQLFFFQLIFFFVSFNDKKYHLVFNLPNRIKLDIVQLHILQKYMDIAYTIISKRGSDRISFEKLGGKVNSHQFCYFR